MTYTTKIYRRLHDLNAWYNERTHTIRMWLGFAKALQKNRTKHVIMLFFCAGPLAIIIVSLLTLLIP